MKVVIWIQPEIAEAEHAERMASGVESVAGGLLYHDRGDEQRAGDHAAGQQDLGQAGRGLVGGG